MAQQLIMAKARRRELVDERRLRAAALAPCVRHAVQGLALVSVDICVRDARARTARKAHT